MTPSTPTLLGIGWRPEIARFIERRRDLGMVELLAEDFDPLQPLPVPLVHLRERGVQLIPHGVNLSLGGAEPLDPRRIKHLARMAQWCQAPLVSEHIAFVRSGNLESGHLLPVPRTETALQVLVENIRQLQAELKVPLALENIASLFDWPDATLTEPAFLCALIERCDIRFLLDIENIYANCRNRGGDPLAFLEQIPLNRVAYVHIAGGVERDGIYHDTHGHIVPEPVLELLTELCARVAVPAVVLERDSHFPIESKLHAELDAIAQAIEAGTVRRSHGSSATHRTASSVDACPGR